MALKGAHPLLKRPADAEATRYHDQLVAGDAERPPLPVAVRLDAGGERGKGLFASRDIQEGDVIFEERALAGVQHLESKAELPACPQCFRALASPEQCIAGILCATIGRLTEEDGHGHSGGSDGGSSDGSSGAGVDPLEAARRVKLIEAAVDAPMLQGLIEGTHKLPHSDLVPTPKPVPCPGACEERYCSAACAETAWAAHHCLLCPVGRGDAKGKGKARAGPAAGGSGRPHMASGSTAGAKAAGGSGSGSGSRGRKAATARPEAEELVHGVRLRRGRLAAFLEHADENNDMFRLAAQVLAHVLINADLKLQQLLKGAEAEDASGGAASSSSGGGGGGAQEGLRAEALHQAWLPFAVAEKAPYWEVAAAGEGDDMEEFRAHIKETTGDSLRLLKAAWPQTPWPEMLELEVYGSVIGMFEQNNLALNVPCPAEVYFGALQDEALVPDAAERAALEQKLEPLRLALGEDLEGLSIEGTAFYALQSCCNHSCEPAAAAEGGPSGAARILALRRIATGEEVTLSYIQEEGAGLEARRAALAAYGFVCRCGRCEAEALAGELAAGAGVSA